jgi:hypothetical protein
MAKALITKSIEDKTDINLALINWRDTPNKIGTSPTQRLFSRRTLWFTIDETSNRSKRKTVYNRQ